MLTDLEACCTGVISAAISRIVPVCLVNDDSVNISPYGTTVDGFVVSFPTALAFI